MKSLLNKFYIRINCQKFILLIILIFFYSCENNSSLRLKCVFKSIDEKYLISPTYKIGEEAYFLYELKSKKYIVTEQHIKHYLVSSTRGGYYLSYTELDRYSGVMT